MAILRATVTTFADACKLVEVMGLPIAVVPAYGQSHLRTVIRESDNVERALRHAMEASPTHEIELVKL